MTIKYEGERVYLDPYRTERQEFDTKEEAKAYVAECSIGRVITWAVHPNLPGCLPPLRYYSCALETLENGAWRRVNIH